MNGRTERLVGRLSLGFLATAAMTALLLTSAARASAGTLDQHQTSSNSNAGLVTNQSLAQTFTAGITGALDQADLLLFKVGTPPATVTVEIRSTSAGRPTATVLAGGNFSTAGIGDIEAFFPVTFATPATVTAGAQYALVAYTAGVFGDTIGWLYQDSGNPYPSGAQFSNNDPIPPGSNWFGPLPEQDAAFKTYVAPSTTPAGEDPKCERLRKKLKRQKANLAKARSKSKRSMLQGNIEETKQRLVKLGCK